MLRGLVVVDEVLGDFQGIRRSHDGATLRGT